MIHNVFILSIHISFAPGCENCFIIISQLQWCHPASLQFEEIRFEAGCCLAEIYVETGQLVQAKQVLQEAMKGSQRLPYWHCRHLFQLAVR